MWLSQREVNGDPRKVKHTSPLIHTDPETP